MHLTRLLDAISSLRTPQIFFGCCRKMPHVHKHLRLQVLPRRNPSNTTGLSFRYGSLGQKRFQADCAIGCPCNMPFKHRHGSLKKAHRGQSPQGCGTYVLHSPPYTSHACPHMLLSPPENYRQDALGKDRFTCCSSPEAFRKIRACKWDNIRLR